MVKKRISLTLDEDVVDRIDERLERKGIDNRSRGIEQLLKEYLKQESVSKAVVLGGGAESNALIPINGRPVITHILDHVEAAGVEQVFIPTGDPTVEDTVSDDRELSVDVILEDEPSGTAGALRHVADKITDTVLVMNGDVLCTPDLSDMKQAHDDRDGLATMALTTVRESAEYGVIRMKGDQIVGFKEKPDESFSHLINAGMYLLDPAFMDRIPDRTTQRTVDVEDIFEQLADEGKLNGYVYEGEWREVG